MVVEQVSIDAPASQGSEEVPARRADQPDLPTAVVAGLAAWLSWLRWEALAQYGPVHTIWAGQFELAVSR
jgi:hypothetical protein